MRNLRPRWWSKQAAALRQTQALARSRRLAGMALARAAGELVTGSAPAEYRDRVSA